MVVMALTRTVTIRGVLLWALLQALLNKEVLGQVPERRYACWGSFGPPVVSAQCPRNTVIQVIRAGLKVQNHGGLCTYNDNDCGCEYGQTGCQMQDVRQLCMGRPACRLDVTQQYISTATCKGFSDYMYIEFNCVPVEHNSVSDICSAVQTKSEHGFLRSPNYPGVSRAMRECDCTLTTDDSSSIELTVLDIQTGEYTCDHDKLLVAYDGRTDTYCGDKSEKATQKIASKSSVVSVKFDTDGKGVGGSFWLKYEAEPKADVKLICSYKETETTTLETYPTTAEETTLTRKTTEAYQPSPRFYTPKKPIREEIKIKEEKSFDNTKIPWWKKVIENVERTKKMAKTTPSPVLVDSQKFPITQARTKPDTTSMTTTSNQHYHQYENKHPKLIQANQGKFPIAGKLSPSPASFGSYVDNSGRRWSHLPKSLLSKLQFPLPVIRALEKELVPKRTQRPYLRILPELEVKKPTLTTKSKSNSALLSDQKQPRRIPKEPIHLGKDPQHRSNYFDSETPRRRDDSRLMTRKTTKVTLRPKNVKSFFAKPKLNIAKKTSGTTSATTIFSKPSIQKKKNVIKKKKKVKPLMMETPSKETVHYFEQLSNEPPLHKKKEKRKRQRKKPHSILAPIVKDNEERIDPTMLPESVPTTPKYVTKEAKSKRKSLKRRNRKGQSDKGKGKNEKISKQSQQQHKFKLQSEKFNEETSTLLRKYKKPTSKEAIQPSWEEPLGLPFESELQPYPKVMESFKPRQRPKSASQRRKQRQKSGKHSITGADEEISRILPKKGKPKRIWKERSDKTKVSIIRPEPKMYVQMTRSQRRRQRKLKKILKLNDKRKKNKAKLEPIHTTTSTEIPTTSITTKRLPTTTPSVTIGSSTRLKDSVHNDVVVVEELAGKVETVSDFYKTLNEEDWTQWPAFEMVKNAKEQQSKSTETKRVKQKAKQEQLPVQDGSKHKDSYKLSGAKLYKPKPRSPSKRRWKVVRPPPTTPKAPTGAAPTPPHTIQTAQPAMLANSQTLDSSIAEMPKSTKVSSASHKTKIRRPPTNSVKADFIPSKSESLTNPKDNMITIIAACVVASILMVIVLGIVIRFVVNRKQDNSRTAPLPKAKRYKQQSVADFPIQKIPRPKRI